MKSYPSTVLRKLLSTLFSFESLAEEFCVEEKTLKSPAINVNLADIVNTLLNEKLKKLQSKYLRPDNCSNLGAPKINEQIWQQLRQETRNSHSSFYKAQSLLMSDLYGILQMCNGSGVQIPILSPPGLVPN